MALKIFRATIFLAVCVTSSCQHFQNLFDVGEKASEEEQIKNLQKKPQGTKLRSKRSVQKIDKKTYIYQVERIKVWKSLLDILARDYNVTLVDLKSGIITTEWDRYYLEGQAYRNRITLRTKKLNGKETRITINNKVEILTNDNWLPSDKGSIEVNRIVFNLSKSLGQILPP